MDYKNDDKMHACLYFPITMYLLGLNLKCYERLIIHNGHTGQDVFPMKYLLDFPLDTTPSHIVKL